MVLDLMIVRPYDCLKPYGRIADVWSYDRPTL